MLQSRKLAAAYVVVLALGFLADREALAQARPNLALQRVIYSSTKSMVKPQGELKEKIDALDQEIAEAVRLGRTGEVRRLLAKGMALLRGREWNNALEFSSSLVLRSEAVFVDSSKPYAVRLEQIYTPKVELAGPLSVIVSAHKPQREGRLVRAGEKIKDIAKIDGVARDLMDEPARIELPLDGLADGTTVIQAEASAPDGLLGTATLLIQVHRGLDERLRRLEAELAKVRGFERVRADVLYPLDYVRNSNRARIEIGTFDVEKETARAESALLALKNGKDPFAGRTGDLERHYFLEGAGEIMPYRAYVPIRYTGKDPFPLVLALHGLGANEDSFFEGYDKALLPEAEKRGYLVAAPMGYRVDGGYGFSLFRSAGDVGQSRKVEYSEKDVLEVLARMRENYNVDPNRIYLMGHSMGAIGTWHLATKYPEIWAALAPFAGFGLPESVVKIKHIPEIVVHGDADPTVPVAGSRAMVAKMKELGVKHRYIEVPGGDHINIVSPNFGAVFDFFDANRKTAASTQ